MSVRSLKDRWAALDEARRNQLLQGATGEQPEPEPQPLMFALLEEEEESDPDPFDGIVVIDPHDTNPNVRGPCCRRPKALDNLLDLTPIPIEIREPMLAAAGLPLFDAICGTCLGRFVRSGGKRSDLYEALGAPPELVAKFRSVE